MIYGAYKNSRDAAWQCLIDYRVDSLPADVRGVARAAGIKIVKNSAVDDLMLSESGISVFDGQQWFIVYDDENTRHRCRFTISHELGHIFLGHELVDGRHGRTFDTDRLRNESEANVFASRLLAPACVLWGLGLHGADDIARVCDISMAAARIRAERMAILYDRNKFLVSSLERLVYGQFEAYIKKNKKR